MVTSLKKLNNWLSLQQPPRPGLIPKKVPIHTEHGVFQGIRWIRPGQLEIPEKIKNDIDELTEEHQQILDARLEEFKTFDKGDINRVLRQINELTNLRREELQQILVVLQDRQAVKKRIQEGDSNDAEYDWKLENIDGEIQRLENHREREIKGIKFYEIQRFFLENELKNPDLDLRVEREKKKYISDSTPDDLQDVDSSVKTKTSLGGGINVTEIIVTENKKKFVFKPKSGERFRNFGKTFGFTREIAAYQLAKELGIADKNGRVLVPRTIVKVIDGEIGSAQEYVEGEFIESHGTFRDKNKVKIPEDQFYNAAIFDLIIGNTDRHGGNSLVDENGNIYLIDNGYSFWPESQRYSFGGTYLGGVEDQKLKLEHRQILERVVNDKKIKNLIMRLLEEGVVYQNIVGRAKAALDQDTYTPELEE